MAVTGCQTALPARTVASVSASLGERSGAMTELKSVSPVPVLPPGASLSHALTSDEAVAIGLYNNPAFQELLVDLGLARGDLIQAGLLPNPELVYYFGVSDKPFKYLLDFPIEALWLRPIKVRAATADSDRAAQRLTQGGLDLIRDVRQAHADVLLAKERVRIAGESVKLRGTISSLAEKRLKAGDISPQEAATARIDALQAEQDAARVGYEVSIAMERLRNLIGLGVCREPLEVEQSVPPECRLLSIDEIAAESQRSRPDALAAQSAVDAAEARLHFSKLGWVRFLGILDATSGRNGHEFGPALRFTLPIFNRNQGGIARAEAEYEKALRNRETVANQIALDVQRSYLLYRQTCTELEFLRVKVRPEVEAAIRRAQGAYQEGNVAIFIVLETTRQLLDNYLREAQLVADLRRNWAELERSAGRRLGTVSP
ncbi:TolC family protein [soil metagenome]